MRTILTIKFSNVDDFKTVRTYLEEQISPAQFNSLSGKENMIVIGEDTPVTTFLLLGGVLCEKGIKQFETIEPDKQTRKKKSSLNDAMQSMQSPDKTPTISEEDHIF